MMGSDLLSSFFFLLATICMLGIVFAILLAVGHRRNKAFRNATPEERAAIFSREPRVRDIVLLSDGVRVTLTECMDDGASFLSQTVNEYGKRPELRTVTRAEIEKIEYYS